MGKATAQILAQNNYKIILCGRRPLKRSKTAFTEVHTLTFDVRDKKAVFESINFPEAFYD
jgi:NADP-dependent 3-hydroxy acid dehydrogenase YdfG